MVPGDFLGYFHFTLQDCLMYFLKLKVCAHSLSGVVASHLQEQGAVVEATRELTMDGPCNMFAVCPRGGCTCMLTAEQQQHFNFLYNGVCTIVRKCEASRKNILSDPLILRFVSGTLNADEYALVCFSTRSYPMEIAFAQLFWAASSQSTYNLTLRGVGGRRAGLC